MLHDKYLIVGGGMTGAAAAHAIRELDHSGSIGLISAEPCPPYDRPPLSKGLWKDKPLESIWRQTGQEGVTLHLGRNARRLDPSNRAVTDDQGTVYGYDKLLLATGAAPRRLPFGGEQIIYFRTLADYQRLRAAAYTGRRFVVIGGGFIGWEIASALSSDGKEVVMIFPEDGIGSRLFPGELAKFLNDYYRQRGVEVLAGSSVNAVEPQPGCPVLKLCNVHSKCEREIRADAVVAGIGVEPNVELARVAGLTVENGVRVNASLRTSQPDIFAAGDVACFHNTTLDRWLRVEHEDNANAMGHAAGLSMAGQPVSYDYLPTFYSDLFDLGFEAVGELDSRSPTVVDWKSPFHEGVVYYLRGGRVCGVLLWNVWGQVDAARGLIAERGPFDAANLKGRLPA